MIEEAKTWHSILSVIDNPSMRATQESIDRKLAIAQKRLKQPYNGSVDVLIVETFTLEDQEAIRSLLSKIAETFADHTTFIDCSSYSPSLEVRSRWMVPYWVESVRGLIFFGSNGAIRKSRPYGSGSIEGTPSQTEREYLYCCDHMQSYPNTVKEVLSVCLAKIHIRDGSEDKAIAALEALVHESYPRLLNLGVEDLRASHHHDGRLVRSVERPVEIALQYLSAIFEQKGEEEKAIAMAEKLVSASSPQGSRYRHNERLANLYMKQGIKESKALGQYRIALSGYLEDLQQKVEGLDDSARKQLPLDDWGRRIEDIKKGINAAGGNVNIDSNELESIIDKKKKGEPESALDPDAMLDELKEMHLGRGKYADPKERKRGASDLVNMMKKQEANTTKENREEIKKVRKSLALGLARMAVVDADADVRTAMVDSVNEVIQPQAEHEEDPISDTDKQKVDTLLAQIIGKDVEKPVPYPETNLADMNASALLYAATQVKAGSLSVEAKRLVTKALANSESPVLYTFFRYLVRDNEDAELKKLAVRGLGRIIKNADIDDAGMILISK
jgi:hypothetical protein